MTLPPKWREMAEPEAEAVLYVPPHLKPDRWLRLGITIALSGLALLILYAAVFR